MEKHLIRQQEKTAHTSSYGTKAQEPETEEARLPTLNRHEIFRYSRHLILPEVGFHGQRRLKGSRVLLVGAGALGSPLGLYLAAAGVGCIGIVDDDRVDESNLQRQIIHGTADVGRLKSESARDRLLELNPYLTVLTFNSRISSANALEIISEFDLVVDGSDNFPTRYLLNDACALAGKPDVFGSVYRFQGQVAVFDASCGSCLRCLFPEPPPPDQTPSCGEGGVLGVLPGLVGSIQATESIRLLLEGSGALVNRFLTVDAWEMRFHEFRLSKNPNCPLCGNRPTIHKLIDYEQFCGMAPQPEEKRGGSAPGISPRELQGLLDNGANIQIIDVRLPDELLISHLPQAQSIPLAQLLQHLDSLDPEREVVLICKKGEKSALAIQALREEGYRGPLFNLVGGLNAWARDIDPSMAQY